MKPMALLLTSLFFFTFAHAGVKTVTTNTPLKDKSLVSLVTDSVSAFLEYADENIAGGLTGELSQPTIVSLVKNEKDEALELTVQSQAYYMSTDFDFGDPVTEVTTVCTTQLKKVETTWTALKTTCDYQPDDYNQ